MPPPLSLLGARPDFLKNINADVEVALTPEEMEGLDEVGRGFARQAVVVYGAPNAVPRVLRGGGGGLV